MEEDQATDTREDILRLGGLVVENPQQAMEELELLLRCRSVSELAQILRAVYSEITEEIGIDWHFTALQWKLGNRGREHFSELSEPICFTVWSFACQSKGNAGPETRYTTCLPFRFKPEWRSDRTKEEGAARSGGRYRI